MEDTANQREVETEVRTLLNVPVLSLILEIAEHSEALPTGSIPVEDINTRSIIRHCAYSCIVGNVQARNCTE